MNSHTPEIVAMAGNFVIIISGYLWFWELYGWVWGRFLHFWLFWGSFVATWDPKSGVMVLLGDLDFLWRLKFRAYLA